MEPVDHTHNLAIESSCATPLLAEASGQAQGQPPTSDIGQKMAVPLKPSRIWDASNGGGHNPQLTRALSVWGTDPAHSIEADMGTQYNTAECYNTQVWRLPSALRKACTFFLSIFILFYVCGYFACMHFCVFMSMYYVCPGAPRGQTVDSCHVGT